MQPSFIDCALPKDLQEFVNGDGQREMGCERLSSYATSKDADSDFRLVNSPFVGVAVH
jgi:hypothetical protein